MSDDLAKELENLEREFMQLDDVDPDVDTGSEEPEGKPAEEPESAEPDQEPAPEKAVEVAEAPDEIKDQGGPEGGEQEHALTTLPDDKEAFGALAGQKVTAKQIMEAGLLEKLVTWGHQGRYMVQKGQKELEEAKNEKSEAEKLRLLLEERFKKEDAAAEQKSVPQVSEDQFAQQLMDNYLPGLKEIVEAGGFEKDFITDFPKVASHLEHRFQAGGSLLQGLIKEVDSIREFVGMQKEQLEKKQATSSFEGLLDQVGDEGELFNGLKDSQGKVDFIKWVTNESTGLRIAEKNIAEVSPDDVKSAYLYYLHTHPDAFKAPAAAPVADRKAHLAGGGAGKTPSKRTKEQLDEFEAFEREVKQFTDAQYAE